jgi:LPS-assembly lipoprotein
MRLLVLTLMALSLTACGFKPMHAPNAFSDTGYSFEKISVTTLKEEKADFLLKQALRDRFGDNQGTEFELRIDSKVKRSGLGIGADDVASRYDMSMTAKFELVERKSGETVHKGSVTSVSTFAAPRDPYGTISAENNATEQVARETADRIIIKLASYFETQDKE